MLYDGKVQQDAQRLADSQGFEATQRLMLASATIVSSPAEVTIGQSFDGILDRNRPSMVGIDVPQDWHVEQPFGLRLMP